MKNHMNMMWICVALIALGIAATVAGFGSAYLLIAIPCMLMMVAMVWMMMGGRSGGSGGSDDHKS